MEVKIEKLRGQLRGRVLGAIFLLKDMGIYPDEIVEHNIFRNEPFSRGKVAIDFFRAVKENDINLTKQFLREVPYIIYEHDECGQTVLHWAAKRNYVQMIKLLLKNGADVNKQDILKRPALYFAAKYNFLGSVKALLAGKAKPGLKDN